MSYACLFAREKRFRELHVAELKSSERAAVRCKSGRGLALKGLSYIGIQLFRYGRMHVIGQNGSLKYSSGFCSVIASHR
jgi:hypothetical protein